MAGQYRQQAELQFHALKRRHLREVEGWTRFDEKGILVVLDERDH